MFTENLTVFFNVADFAVDALINNQVVQGIYGDVYVTVNHVEAKKLSFTCACALVANAKNGDVILINKNSYQIVGIKPDGTGLVTLILELEHAN